MSIESIGYRRWSHPDPKAVLLLVHGLGAHSERWQSMAEFFMRRGITSYAVEFGGSVDVPGWSSSYFKDYSRNIINLRDKISHDFPSKRVFLVGESMGALLSFLTLCKYDVKFDALICLSPAFGSKLRLPAIDYVKILLFSILCPKKCIKLPFDSTMCTRDIEYRKIMDSDSRERRSSPARLLVEIMLSQLGAGIVKARLNIPVLFLLAGRDSIADKDVSRRIFEGLAVKDKSIIEYPDMYHSLSVDIGKEKVFEDMLKWVEGRIS